MYPYEAMFLMDPNAYSEQAEEVEQGLRAALEKQGAKIHELERWDERRLAYPIKGHKRGIYLLGYFEMPGANQDALRRDLALHESLLRHLILRLETDIPTHLERSAGYYDKVREDADGRRPAHRPTEGGPGRPEGEAE
ncbi:MAG: 30S ribosomal protein S6 [Planctomycetota bacterium]